MMRVLPLGLVLALGLSMLPGCGSPALVPAGSASAPLRAQTLREPGEPPEDPDTPKEPLTPPNGPARGHVLFVHGHGADPWRFDTMRRALEMDGYRTYTMAFPSMEEDMDWLAWFVKARVGAIRRQHAALEVDLVTHSMGGLISRCYLKYLDGQQHVRRLITLATPHHGLFFAKIPMFPLFMISENLRQQVKPNSKFLNRLNDGDESPGDVRYTSIGSKKDAYISTKSSWLDGATNYVIDGSTHTTIMWDPVPTGLVKGALAEGHP